MENINGQSKNKISVIIPIRRGENITHVLESIKQSTYTNYEIIVVDEGLERSWQRNIGIQKSTGEYLLILDSDQCIDKNLLMECVYLIDYYEALYIPETIMTKGLFAKLRNWERQFYNATAVDCVRFVKRKNCPLFDLTLNGPEDSDWDRKFTGKKGLTNCGFYHYDNVGVFKYFKKKVYYAKSMSKFVEKHPNDKVLSFWWRCFGVFFENGKWRRTIKRPDLMLLVWLVILIRGVIYLWKK